MNFKREIKIRNSIKYNMVVSVLDYADYWLNFFLNKFYKILHPPAMVKQCYWIKFPLFKY